ncbi:argininosuccinate synthase domain-containing protein [Mycobacterium decipiens]|uniref:argininosuccinate synthase n=1 Tax=Mycobacterium decipiens TaxID=1430326 RepID=A0A1X2LWF4_9MYCO|nr:argininosuccinate synthase domain-containing protein [Mycobacterium decipiens]OSC40856.1 hypothetical protein B8W66_11850 [Mycobacterium decipiens]
MSRVLTSLDELAKLPPQPLLLLYSGGLDGTYFLKWAQNHTIRIVALRVAIGDGTNSFAEANANYFGAEYIEIDASQEYYQEFLPAAIHADALYQNMFPISSSLTRPLIARVACRAARERGIDCVGHTATWKQNSAVRLSASLMAQDSDLVIASPFVRSHIPREAKLRSLQEEGLDFCDDPYSIDTTPWARVIESGPLEDPRVPPAEDVFRWTRPVENITADSVEIRLKFDRGLPCGMNGESASLEQIVNVLNDIAGLHGIGRYSGLEDTPFGFKSREVREAPAAAVILAGHKALANATIPPDEYSVRSYLANEWTVLAVHGRWFSHLARCLRECLAALDVPVSGEVSILLQPGIANVRSVDAPGCFCHSSLAMPLDEAIASFDVGPWLAMRSLSDMHTREI